VLVPPGCASNPCIATSMSSYARWIDRAIASVLPSSSRRSWSGPPSWCMRAPDQRFGAIRCRVCSDLLWRASSALASPSAFFGPAGCNRSGAKCFRGMQEFSAPCGQVPGPAARFWPNPWRIDEGTTIAVSASVSAYHRLRRLEMLTKKESGVARRVVGDPLHCCVRCRARWIACSISARGRH